MPKIILAAVLAALTLSACNTVKGAGQDVSTAGHAVTNEADKAQDQM